MVVAEVSPERLPGDILYQKLFSGLCTPYCHTLDLFWDGYFFEVVREIHEGIHQGKSLPLHFLGSFKPCDGAAGDEELYLMRFAESHSLADIRYARYEGFCRLYPEAISVYF